MTENVFQDKPLSAYFGDKKIKKKYVKRMESHIKADELIHGTGWDSKSGKGCAVGCTLNRFDHHCYQNELGLPEWLAQLEDILFENMSRWKSKTFPLEFLKAIPLGANLDVTYHKFCKFVLTDIAKDCNEEPVRKVIETVLSQHDKAIKGEIITIPALGRMYSAARSAARSAAWSAAESAAESAAWSAAESAAESAAWSAAFDKMADKLIELLKESNTFVTDGSSK